MTELYGFAPPDIEEFVVAWLAPLGPVSVERPAGAPLPYRMVLGIPGTEDRAIFSADCIVSVHTFAADRYQAKNESKITHRRMMALCENPMLDVIMPSGIANCEYLEVFEPRHWEPYADNVTISRYVARYRLGLKFVAV